MFKTRRRKPNILVLMSIALLLLVILWNYRSTWLVSQLIIEPLGQGEVKHEKTVTGIFANTEVVIASPVEGKINMICEQGRRLGRGEIVARLGPSGVNPVGGKTETPVTAPIAGLFYSNLDNLESIVTPENLMNMELAKILTQVEKNQQAKGAIEEQGEDSEQDQDQEAESELQVETEAGSEEVNQEAIVKKNAPLGKMVNNLYPSWMFVQLENSDKMKKGDTYKFIIDDEEYAGVVMKVSDSPRGAVIRFSEYVKGSVENRLKDLIWQYKPTTKGLVVPVESLRTYGEERGVYIVSRQIIRFKNVRIIDANANLAHIEGIPEGTLVVLNPMDGIEGMAVKK